LEADGLLTFLLDFLTQVFTIPFRRAASAAKYIFLAGIDDIFLFFSFLH